MIVGRASEPIVDGHRVVVRPRHGSMSDLVPRSSAVARAFVSPPVTRHRYNKRQSDFSALKEYNDYLEETEAIIFNLCEGVETRATETKVEAYRRENAADIARRQQRNAEEDRRLGARDPGMSERAADAGEPSNAAGADPWAPRRMSADVSDLDETPGPGGAGLASARNVADGGGGGGFGGLFGYTPGSLSGHGKHAQQVVPVPASAAPAPMSAGKMMEGGHGRHAHHAGWDDAASDPAARAKREADIAAACGVDLRRLGRERAAQEALTSVFC